MFPNRLTFRRHQNAKQSTPFSYSEESIHGQLVLFVQVNPVHPQVLGMITIVRPVCGIVEDVTADPVEVLTVSNHVIVEIPLPFKSGKSFLSGSSRDGSFERSDDRTHGLRSEVLEFILSFLSSLSSYGLNIFNPYKSRGLFL